MMRACRHAPNANAFTLVELLVSMAVVSILLVGLVSITDSTRRSWSSSKAKIEQFRAAREAFESISRRLSQATLNTYWDYHYPGGNTTLPPDKYMRKSELRFIAGTSSDLSLGENRWTHGIFFQAPLGYVSSTTYSPFKNLLNTCGFFVDFGSDIDQRPSFITTGIFPDRSRFRIMELLEPSDAMTLYQAEVLGGGAAAYTGRDWYATPLADPARISVLAENVIALVILPRLSPDDEAALDLGDDALAPTYLYDSTGLGMTTCGDANLNPMSQLPPVVQVSMVAIDEVSASRMGDAGASALQSKLSSLFIDPKMLKEDLRSLEDYLIRNRIGYRIFTTNINIKTAKWSRNQTN